MLLPGVAKRILGFDFGDLTLFADICVVHVDDVLYRVRLSAAEAAPLLLCRLHEGEMTIVVAGFLFQDFLAGDRLILNLNPWVIFGPLSATGIGRPPFGFPPCLGLGRASGRETGGPSV